VTLTLHPTLSRSSSLYALRPTFSSCFFFFSSSGDHRDLPSFPTRRSSDLWRVHPLPEQRIRGLRLTADDRLELIARGSPPPDVRSEEHTSELQSHLNLVCRLLLEKKKKHKEVCVPALYLRATHTRTQ